MKTVDSVLRGKVSQQQLLAFILTRWGLHCVPKIVRQSRASKFLRNVLASSITDEKEFPILERSQFRGGVATDQRALGRQASYQHRPQSDDAQRRNRDPGSQPYLGT